MALDLWWRVGPHRGQARSHSGSRCPCGSGLARDARSEACLLLQVFSTLQRFIPQQQVLVVVDLFFFEQTPGPVAFHAEQFDEAPAFDLVGDLADVATRFAVAAGQVDLAVFLRLGRRDQVQFQAGRVAVAGEVQFDFAGQLVQANLGVQLQGLGQAFAVQGAIDAFASLVIVVVDQVVRVVHCNGHHGQGQGHRAGQDCDDDPGPEVLVPGACGSGYGHCSALSLTNLWADESALGFNMDAGIISILEDECDLVGARRQLLRRARQFYRHADDVAGSYLDFAAALQLEVRQAGSVKHVGVVVLILVHDLQAVDVFDPPLGILAVQHAVLADVEAHQRTHEERRHQQADHGQQYQRVTDQARSQFMGFLPGEVVFGGVADQPAGVLHLVHDAVAGVDAGGATDALDLQAVTDVDAGGADLHAHRAVDAVAQALGLVVGAFLARATLFAPARVVGDDQGILVEHHALEARIGAHVDAHLFAQPAGVAVGGEGEEADPEVRPAIGLAGEEVKHQFADRREVADEGHAGDKTDQQPQRVLAEFAQELVGAHRRIVQLDALVAVAFGDLFAPHEDPRPHALRAGIPAPDTPGVHRDEEQAKGRDDQDAREEDEVLGPEGCTENKELTFRQVPPHGLVAAPVQPHRAEVEQEQTSTAEHAQVAEQPGEGAGVDFLSRRVEIDTVVRFFGRGRNVMYRYLVAHHCIPRRWRFA